MNSNLLIKFLKNYQNQSHYHKHNHSQHYRTGYSFQIILKWEESSTFIIMAESSPSEPPHNKPHVKNWEPQMGGKDKTFEWVHSL